jgi:hypothetical protein
MIDFFAWITNFSIELLGFLASLAVQQLDVIIFNGEN